LTDFGVGACSSMVRVAINILLSIGVHSIPTAWEKL
jgi:hypothetical protein